MKIIFFEATAEDKEIFSQLLTGHDLTFTEEGLKPGDNVLSGAEVLSIFVNSEITKEIIDSLPNMKFIATRSTGFDHIDVSYAQSKGIAVANVPSYGSYTVAEFTFALMLNLSRNIFQAYHQLREGTDFNIINLRGFDLRGKTLGVIGIGRIGKNVVRIAKSFGMNILGHDAYPDESFAKETSFRYVHLTELLGQSDIVTIHVPYNKDTHHMINKETVKFFKKGACLINTARGEVVETEALLWALNEGIIAKAALDVLEGERELKEEAHLLTDRPERIKDIKTLAENHVLIDAPQVIVTPHIAFDSVEAVREIIETTADNIKAFAAGKPQNIVSVKSL